MKKMLCSLVLLTLTASMALADEGMWMLPLLQKMNAGAMKDLGCRLTPEEIYSVNHTSLKDAIVHFGGGCTGEVISREGLVVTNHHCGYSHIQKLSSPEHNYLEDGYWAMTRAEELPAKGLTVTFLESMTDVTAILDKVRAATLKQYKDSTNREVLAIAAVNQTREALQKQAEAEVPHSQARITSFYNSNVFYLIVSKTYTDIRFVGAPPASVGKFGGETDNWMWPRHTGDFSMFRIYAGADNEPADYSEDNVPYVPKQALKVSLKGYQDGDFTMIMGYPGRTQRFQTAAQLQQMLNRQAISVEARTLRQDIMWEAMEADPKVRLQYANKYAGSANGWKKWQGQKLSFEKLGILERQQQKEADFMKWVGKNKKRRIKYGTALQDIAEAVAASADGTNATTLLMESVYQIELMHYAPHFLQFCNRSLSSKTERDTLAALQEARKQMDALYRNYSADLDRKEAIALLEFYRNNAKPEDFLEIPGEDFATMDIPAYVNKLFDESVLTSYEKLSNATEEQLQNDPAAGLMASITGPLMKHYMALYGSAMRPGPGGRPAVDENEAKYNKARK
ncbi:MAG: S46 family peptidase, partial [Bacteroidales bacterium]|nr:S46 family peptidase [Bacteroidales bacterium]